MVFPPLAQASVPRRSKSSEQATTSTVQRRMQEVLSPPAWKPGAALTAGLLMFTPDADVFLALALITDRTTDVLLDTKSRET